MMGDRQPQYGQRHDYAQQSPYQPNKEDQYKLIQTSQTQKPVSHKMFTFQGPLIDNPRHVGHQPDEHEAHPQQAFGTSIFNPIARQSRTPGKTADQTSNFTPSQPGGSQQPT